MIHDVKLDEVETAIFDGWRYLGKDAAAVLSYTPREFTIMVRAQDERLYDEYDRMAVSAMMQRQATNAKRLKQSDLFKRPVDGKVAEEKMLGIKEKAENATDWLSQFSNFRG